MIIELLGSVTIVKRGVSADMVPILSNNKSAAQDQSQQVLTLAYTSFRKPLLAGSAELHPGTLAYGHFVSRMGFTPGSSKEALDVSYVLEHNIGRLQRHQ